MRKNACFFAVLLILMADLASFSQSPSPSPSPAAKPSPQSQSNIIEIPIPGESVIPGRKHSELYGLGKDPSLVYALVPLKFPDQASGIQIVSSTRGVDFGPYMKHFREPVQNRWYQMIPEVALPPTMKSGAVTIEVKILNNGSLRDMKIIRASGDAELDHAAWFALKNSVPFPALPAEFTGEYLLLRCSFYYNTNPAPQPSPSATASSPSPSPSPTPN